MGERRLIEISRIICNLDDNITPMDYLTTLKESEIYLFLKYVGSSKYNGMELQKAIVEFSKDYLTSKNVTIKK